MLRRADSVQATWLQLLQLLEATRENTFSEHSSSATHSVASVGMALSSRGAARTFWTRRAVVRLSAARLVTIRLDRFFDVNAGRPGEHAVAFDLRAPRKTLPSSTCQPNRSLFTRYARTEASHSPLGAALRRKLSWLFRRVTAGCLPSSQLSCFGVA
jgi:hypothetical protein